MRSQQISYRNSGYVSKIICDLFEGNKQLSQFYGETPEIEKFKKQFLEKQKTFTKKKRKVLVDSLTSQYDTLLLKDSLVYQNIKNISLNNTFTVTTGHQLNLMTGPLYFLFKIISTINLCKKLKIAYPESNFVPVYWMATEDHDFDEISFFNFNRKNFKWNRNKAGAVGKFPLDGIESLFSVFENNLGSSSTAQEIKELIRISYLSSKTLAEATRKLVHRLFNSEGLVILDGDDRALKMEFAPKIKEELQSSSCEIHVNKTISKLQTDYDSSYLPQVNPRQINLFYLTAKDRLRLIRTATGFTDVDKTMSWTAEELLQEVENTPERFSPNVLIRPLYQETILPNLCYVGGGGELAYWLEIKSYFESQKVLFPILLHRNAAVLVPKKIAKKIDNMQMSPLDFFLKRPSLINKKVRQISNIDLDLQYLKKTLETQFNSLEKLVIETDASFEGVVKAQKTKQFKGIDRLEKRLLKAQKRKLADQVQRLLVLHDILFPNETLQERTVNFSEFYLQYGSELLSILSKNLDPLSFKFDWIILD
jgi:bacillithiol biosynthesis cysteine-adding enzyme BshC